MRLFSLLFTVLGLFLFTTCRQSVLREKDAPRSPSEAGVAFQWWGMARTFPDGQFHTEKYAAALAQMQLEAQFREDRDNTWEALGPKNIGGRTLCLAINPLDTNSIWAGSASGGLWKSTTAGRGAAAWQRVETSFPVLGVATIAIDPVNPNVMYIGTGEVYDKEHTMPNVAVRTTRGTYGIGILKSTDGGLTWIKSLDWAYGDLRGVQDIKINPKRPATLYAATTEGLLRSYDAGASWKVVHAVTMAVDIEIGLADTARIFVTHGSFQNIGAGIYRSSNGGQSFTQLGNGLPTSYSGKALIGASPSNPTVLYASIGNVTEQEGLYKTTNGGDSWIKVNSQDVCTYQGWYSHDVAVRPDDPDQIIWTGINLWKSTDGGLTVNQKTTWYLWNFGQVPVGGPEGPGDYVHADIHRVYYLPNDPNKVYCVSDGGIFVSYDGGENWEGRNGSYQTQQFYANFSNSTSNPDLAIGGMQDNATAIYTGSPAWTRVIGGDGECTALSPVNDNIMYGSSQYLNLLKSTDGGANFYGIVTNPEMNGEAAAFNGPLEIAPSDANILYAGAQSLWRSEDGGETWINASNGYLADADLILTIAIDPQNADVVYCSTAPTTTGIARVIKFDYSMGTKTVLTGLPNRLCMDIAISPANSQLLFAAFSGFNIQHVWRSQNGGLSWQAADSGLPDVPTNTLLLEPALPGYLYVGNDVGMWLSKDHGANWEPYSVTAPQAMLVMHLSFSADHQIRVATHGLGVWQTPAALASSTQEAGKRVEIQSIYPNPTTDLVTVKLNLPQAEKVTYRVVDVSGKTVLAWPAERVPAGVQSRTLQLGALPAGTYGLVVETGHGRNGKLVVKR